MPCDIIYIDTLNTLVKYYLHFEYASLVKLRKKRDLSTKVLNSRYVNDYWLQWIPSFLWSWWVDPCWTDVQGRSLSLQHQSASYWGCCRGQQSLLSSLGSVSDVSKQTTHAVGAGPIYCWHPASCPSECERGLYDLPEPVDGTGGWCSQDHLTFHEFSSGNPVKIIQV